MDTMRHAGKTKVEDRGKSQATAQLESIRAMVKELEACDEHARNTKDYATREAAEQAIQEDALEIAVRSDWHTPGETSPDAASGTAVWDTRHPWAATTLSRSSSA